MYGKGKTSSWLETCMEVAGQERTKCAYVLILNERRISNNSRRTEV